MPGNRDHSSRLLGFARQMRHGQTDSERKMWTLVRDRKLQGFKFRRQYPIAGYIVDFICLGSNLVVELDGGHHRDAANVAYDEKRAARLSQLGIRVMRFGDDDVLRDGDTVLQMIYNALVPREPSPRPSPGIPGEGEMHAPSRGNFHE